MLSDWLSSGSATWALASFTYTQAVDTDDRGIAGRLLTADDDGDEGTYRTSTLITIANGFVLGDVYSLIWEVEVIEADQPFHVDIKVANNKRSFNLAEGHHLLHVPFIYLNNTGTTSATLDRLEIHTYHGLDEDSLRFGRITILKGNRTVNTVAYKMEGNAAPSGSQYYAKGDRCYDTSPTTKMGWVCTTPGSSSVWKTFGNI